MQITGMVVLFIGSPVPGMLLLGHTGKVSPTLKSILRLGVVASTFNHSTQRGRGQPGLVYL